MNSRKTVELKFSDENQPEINESVNHTESSFKTLNFGGLIIEVRSSKEKKPTAVNFQLVSKSSSDPAAIKVDENTSPNVNGSFVFNKTESPPRPKKPERLWGNPLPLKETHEVTTVTESLNDLDGAAGLWAQNVEKTEKETLTAKPLTVIEAPAVTEEDLAYMRQLTETLDLEDDNKLVKNQADFICSICELSIKPGQGVSLKGCSHSFCDDCLIKHINTNFDEMGQVKCPLKVEACENYIFDEEVRGLLGELHDEFIVRIVLKQDEAIREKERQDEASKYDTLPALLNADNHDFIANFEEFECSVCLNDVVIGAGLILKNCLHTFCKDCFINTVKHSDDFKVKCPENGCEFSIQEREIRGLVTADVFDKHLELSIKVYEGVSINAYHCKTPDCRGFIEIENKVRDFTCEVCQVKNCIECKAIHEGKTCQQFQDEINPDAKNHRENAESETAIKNLIAAGQAMNCPRCEIPVMKQEGCDFLTCTTCKLGICWRLKRPRHPITKANGLVVDGCHCKENGIPCHPQCQNCH